MISVKNLQPPIRQMETVFENPQMPKMFFISLGDSLTAGIGATEYKNTVPYLLAQKLSKDKSVTLLNLAQSGADSSDVLSSQVPKVLAKSPDLITLMIGTNDVHNFVKVEDFESNLVNILTELKKTKARIIVINIPYLASKKTGLFPLDIPLEIKIKQFNNVIKTVTEKLSVELIDLYTPTRHLNFYSEDGFHPSDEGYRKWIDYINVN